MLQGLGFLTLFGRYTGGLEEEGCTGPFRPWLMDVHLKFARSINHRQNNICVFIASGALQASALHEIMSIQYKPECPCTLYASYDLSALQMFYKLNAKSEAGVGAITPKSSLVPSNSRTSTSAKKPRSHALNLKDLRIEILSPTQTL